MARSWYTRSYEKPNFIQTPRVKAVTRERAWMAAHPHAFGGHDYVAAHLRKRARDRMHTIAREQAYMRTAQFGQFKLNKYQRSKTRYPRRPPMRIKTKKVFTYR